MRTVIVGACYQLGHECLRAERWADPDHGDWLLLADCDNNRLRYRVLPSGQLARLVRRPGGRYDQLLSWYTVRDLRLEARP